MRPTNWMTMQYTTYTRPTFMVNVGQTPTGKWIATVCRRLNPGYPVARYTEPIATCQPTKRQALHHVLKLKEVL